MKAIFLSFFLSFSALLLAQNLVPNPSFEDTIQINGQPGLITWQTNIGSPDYFTAHYLSPLEGRRTPVNIRGVQVPFNGVAYFGLNALDRTKLNRREYLQVQLLDTMVAGQQYEIEFYLSLADSFHVALADSNIGIVLKKDLEPNNFDHMVREFRPFYSSDTAWNASNKMGWEKFHYTHTASGGEDVLVIGCFLTDQEIQTDSVGNGGNFPWARNGSFYYIDQIRVEWKDTSTSVQEIPLLKQVQSYPNPVKETFNLLYAGKEQLTFQLYNIKGQVVTFTTIQQQNNYSFNFSNLKAGVYFLRINNGKQESSIKLVKQ